MLKRVACAILLSAAFHAPPAQAGIYVSGSDLFADCAVPKDNPVYYSRSERCTGFITGVVDLNGVVVGYLNAHPDMRSIAASALVNAALADTWH